LIQTAAYLSNRKIIEVFSAVALLVTIMVGSPAQASIEQQRRLFHDASQALQRNQVSKFNRLLKQLDGYPAQAYLEYDSFRRNVRRLKPQQVELFLQRHADYPFVYHARGRWLDTLARRGDWEGYLEFFDDRANTRLQCISFQARLKLGQFEGLSEEIGKIWLRGYSQPSQCDAAFSYYLENLENPEEVIWARIEKAFKARRPGLALYLGKKLDAQSRATVETWYRAHKRPEKSLRQLTDGNDSERTRDIIVHALDRLARKNSLKALDAWNLTRDQFAFTPEQKAQVQLRIALSAAFQHKTEARALLSSLDPEAMNDQAYLWLARIQLRERDWRGLLNTINLMPAHLYEENEWQYWLSRSMEAEGQLSGSLTLLEQLSGKSSYYGFLAADRLERDYHIEQENAASLGVDEEAFLSENPHMLRARELFFLDRLVDAKREWFQALRYLDQNQIKQAATLASRWQWHDSAIRTVAKTEHRKTGTRTRAGTRARSIVDLWRYASRKPVRPAGEVQRRSTRSDATDAEYRAQPGKLAGHEEAP